MWNEPTSLFLLGDVITEGSRFSQYTMTNKTKLLRQVVIAVADSAIAVHMAEDYLAGGT